jgi:hypothetical protein
MEVIFTDRFLDCYEEYTDYMAPDHVSIAIKWVRGFFEACQKK